MNEKTIKINGAEVTATKEQLERALAGFDEPKSGSVWIPEIGEKYYFTETNRSSDFIDAAQWDNDMVDHWNLAIGNVFKTEAEAEAKQKRDNAKYEVMKAMSEFPPFVPDWEDSRQPKIRVSYSYHHKRLFADSTFGNHTIIELPYMATQEQAKQLIRDQEENLLIMLGIK